MAKNLPPSELAFNGRADAVINRVKLGSISITFQRTSYVVDGPFVVQSTYFMA